MTAIRHVSLVGVALALVAAGGASSSAQPGGNAPAAGLVPLLTIETRVGFGTPQSSSGILPLTPGSWSARLLSSGTAPCANEFTVSADEPEAIGPASESKAAVVWNFRARLVTAKDDTATVALHWSREVNHAGLVPAESVTVEREYTLTDGRTGVLDLVTAAPDSAECPSFAVMIGLQFAPMRPQMDAAIGYDMWLLQDGGDGTVRTDRFYAAGRDTESADYFFKPLSYDSSGNPTTVDGVNGLKLSAYGKLRGTIVDGDIDLLVDARSSYAAGAGGSMTQARKRLRVHDGETVEFEIPAAPAEAQAGSLAALFRRIRTALRVTPHILWQDASPAAPPA